MGDTSDTSEKRLRLQVRVVQTIFRVEIKRLERTPASVERDKAERDLRARSTAILGAVRAELDGKAAWHGDVLRLTSEAEEELTQTGRRRLRGA